MNPFPLKRNIDWTGLVVEIREPMKNGYVSIPAGALMQCGYSRTGLSLHGRPCPCCNIAPMVGGIDRSAVRVRFDLTSLAELNKARKQHGMEPIAQDLPPVEDRRTCYHRQVGPTCDGPMDLCFHPDQGHFGSRLYCPPESPAKDCPLVTPRGENRG